MTPYAHPCAHQGEAVAVKVLHSMVAPFMGPEYHLQQQMRDQRRAQRKAAAGGQPMEGRLMHLKAMQDQMQRDARANESLVKEAFAMSKIDHRNVVRLLGMGKEVGGGS